MDMMSLPACDAIAPNRPASSLRVCASMIVVVLRRYAEVFQGRGGQALAHHRPHRLAATPHDTIHELGDELGGGVLQDLARRADLFDAAFVEDRDPVRKLEGFIL